MYKLLVLTCLLVSCLAEPFGVSSWLSEAGRRHRHPRGCADRAEGWRACTRLNDTDSLAPHGYDCSLFFYCRSPGARPACRKCPAGLHFNPQLQVCDWPANVDCTPRPPPPSRPPRPQPNGTISYPTSTTPEDGTTVSYETTTDYILTDGTKTAAESTTEVVSYTTETTKAVPYTSTRTSTATTEAVPTSTSTATTEAVPTSTSTATTEAVPTSTSTATTEAVPTSTSTATTEAVPTSTSTATTEAVP